MIDNNLIYKIALTLIPKVGPILARRIVSYCGGVEEVFKKRKNFLLKIPGLGESIANNILNSEILKQAEKELKYIEKNNVKTYFYLDPDYPSRLSQCEDAPIILYVKGNINFEVTKIISIVGTRQATYYGLDFCEKLIANLQQYKEELIIVSGLAYGIDIQAHRCALKYGIKTIAVFGHGFNYVYPADHRSIARKIEEHGACITEFTSDIAPAMGNFVSRNRIIAGLSDATIVVESRKEGGALITAELANSYNREVFAVPGRIDDIYSEGCNNLIKENKAAMITSFEDLIYLMGWKNSSNIIDSEIPRTNLSKEEEKILALIEEYKEISIDTIIRLSEINISEIPILLFQLECKGLIKCLPGKIYKLQL